MLECVRVRVRVALLVVIEIELRDAALNESERHYRLSQIKSMVRPGHVLELNEM